MRGRFFIGFGILMGGCFAVACENPAGQLLVLVGSMLVSYELLWHERKR